MWQSACQGAECFYLEAGPRHVFELLHRAFGQDGAKTSQAAITDGDQLGSVLDELSLEDSKAYQAKASKYKKTALTCVADPMFWCVMKLANLTREPLLHFYRILNKAPEPASMPIVDMVSRNLSRLQAEFLQLIRTSRSWVAEAVTACRIQEGHEDLNSFAQDLGLLLVLHCAASFDRRVVQPLQRTIAVRSKCV